MKGLLFPNFPVSPGSAISFSLRFLPKIIVSCTMRKAKNYLRKCQNIELKVLIPLPTHPVLETFWRHWANNSSLLWENGGYWGKAWFRVWTRIASVVMIGRETCSIKGLPTLDVECGNVHHGTRCSIVRICPSGVTLPTGGRGVGQQPDAPINATGCWRMAKATFFGELLSPARKMKIFEICVFVQKSWKICGYFQESTSLNIKTM